ncbi:MAG: Gfo/Idh/MocA family oxidoreductase [Planctomycetales bacterium]|nr:Gfo/Idh/MocA family oxidoreductase [Planctomycetales bacterium]
MNVDRRDLLQIAGGLACAGTFTASLTAILTGDWSSGLNAQESDSAGKRRAPIRVGQIGVGHAHANKLAVYRASPDYEVVGVVESDPFLRAKAQAQAAFRDCNWMSEQQLLELADLQVVLVETQIHDSLATAARCIDAGKHIHLDKPAGASLPEFSKLLKQAERQSLLVQMGYMYRYNPAIVLMRQLLAEGALGDVFEVHAVMSKVVDAEGRDEHAEFSGGMMFELGCHLIDLVVGLLGTPGKITPYVQHASAINDKLNDNMLAVFEYPRALATVKTSAMEVDGFARRHLVICGSKGTMHIQPLDAPAARLTLSEPHGEYAKGTHELTFPNFPRYVADAADMARILRGEKSSDFSYAHDLAVQLAVLQAAQMPIT